MEYDSAPVPFRLLDSYKNYAKYNHGLQPVRWANDIPSEVPFFKILFGNNSHTPTTHLFNV